MPRREKFTKDSEEERNQRIVLSYIALAIVIVVVTLFTIIYWRYHAAAEKIGLKRLGVHSMRHTCRSWMDANGTKLTVQREVMRHSKLEMTGKYGAVITGEEVTAVEQLAEMALGGKAN